MSDKVKQARAEAHQQVLMCSAMAHIIALEDPTNGAKQQGALDPAHTAIDFLILAVAEEVRERAARECTVVGDDGTFRILAGEAVTSIRSLPIDYLVGT